MARGGSPRAAAQSPTPAKRSASTPARYAGAIFGAPASVPARATRHRSLAGEDAATASALELDATFSTRAAPSRRRGAPRRTRRQGGRPAKIAENMARRRAASLISSVGNMTSPSRADPRDDEADRGGHPSSLAPCPDRRDGAQHRRLPQLNTRYETRRISSSDRAVQWAWRRRSERLWSGHPQRRAASVWTSSRDLRRSEAARTGKASRDGARRLPSPSPASARWARRSTPVITAPKCDRRRQQGRGGKRS